MSHGRSISNGYRISWWCTEVSSVTEECKRYYASLGRIELPAKFTLGEGLSLACNTIPKTAREIMQPDH